MTNFRTHNKSVFHALDTCRNTRYMLRLAQMFLRASHIGGNMEVTQLPNEVTQYLEHIKGWNVLIRGEVATILDKIARGESLTRSDLAVEATPSEVAAIWSVKYK